MVLTLCFHERHRDRGQSHFSRCECKIDLSQAFTPGIGPKRVPTGPGQPYRGAFQLKANGYRRGTPAPCSLDDCSSAR